MKSPDLRAEVLRALTAEEMRMRTPDRRGKTVHERDLSAHLSGLAEKIGRYFNNGPTERPQLDQCLKELMWEYFVRQSVLPPTDKIRRSHDMLITTMSLIIELFVAAVIGVLKKSPPTD